MRVLVKAATIAASVLAISLNIEPAQSLPLGPSSASPETAVQKVQQQEFDRERAKARVRQRLGERVKEMTPAERLRAKQRAQQLGERAKEMRKSGYGYVDRERAKARVRQRLEYGR